MFKSSLQKTLFYSLLLGAFILGTAGCSVLHQINPPTATPTEIPPTETPLPSPTATDLPTETPLPTSTFTPAPTATPIPPLAVAPDGINPFCLTKKHFLTAEEGPNGPASKPEKASDGTIDKKTGVINFPIPAINCTLVLKFNQPAPAGMQLQIWDARPQEPFVTYEMAINPVNPNEAYAVMDHSMIVDPPKWWMDYTAVVVTAEGKEVFRNAIHVQKPLPEKCWDGSYPNPITLFCPIQDS
jgi:hypothetical protein